MTDSDILKLGSRFDSLDNKVDSLLPGNGGYSFPLPPPIGGGGGGGLDLSKASLGYKINPAGDDPDKVRIYAGEIDRVAVAQTDLTVADGNYVYVEHDRDAGKMTVKQAGSVPTDDDTAGLHYYRLYRFSVTDGAAEISMIFRPFDIEGGGGLTVDIEVVTDIQYDADTMQLQKKTRLLTFTKGVLTEVVEADPDDIEWETIEGGQAEECP